MNQKKHSNVVFGIAIGLFVLLWMASMLLARPLHTMSPVWLPHVSR